MVLQEFPAEQGLGSVIGLPAFEERFFELLRNQSQQNLATLSMCLDAGTKNHL